MSAALGLGAVVLMALLAMRADRTLAIDQSALPMNFALDGTVLWRAPRRVALWFMPALATLVIIPFAIFAPDTPATAIAALSLLAGQMFYHRLIGRAA